MEKAGKIIKVIKKKTVEMPWIKYDFVFSHGT